MNILGPSVDLFYLIWIFCTCLIVYLTLRSLIPVAFLNELFYLFLGRGPQFNWHAIPEHEKKRRQHSADPAYSPTMAGGLFSIDRAFFQKLGTYDDGFDIWGGENLELSFKVSFSLILSTLLFYECGIHFFPECLEDLDVWWNIGNHSV